MKIIPRLIFTALITMILLGCASSRDLREGESIFDGGYQITPVNKSIFYIFAQTKAAPVARYEDAYEMWKKHASAVCKGHSYQTHQISQQLNNAKVSPFIVTEVMGYVVCADSGLTQDQVIKEIKKYQSS